ncbi:MAG: T9SS type A sorting domain-containing protein [Candidatus Stygibacter frigidus]|nr:T9SS type A sorting domain-containing protein [Candidatus Stygibacter frigidus]
MKKLFIVIIAVFLIFGLSLNAKTDEKTVLRNVDGLAPQQLIGTLDNDVTRDFIQIGNAGVGSFQMPTNLWNLDSMVEVVYLQEWLETEMTINTVSFHASMNSAMNNGCELEIWIGLTAEDDLATGWIDGSNLEQVYNGTIDVPVGDSWYDIPLDEDFVYENIDNLVMLIISHDDETSFNMWWCTDSGMPNRTRIDFANNTTGWEFNALTGPWDSDLANPIYPDVRFHYIPEAGNQPPGEATDVTFAADAGGELETQIDWTCPTLDNAGVTLVELLEMRVYRDSLLIYTDTNPTIGGTGSYLDASITLPGLHEYQLVGYNSIGEGTSVDGELWIGEDVPGAITDIELTDVSTEDLIAQLDWLNPTTGFHGGYFTGVTGYDIVRSDGASFNLTGSATTWQDDSLPESGIYSYTITPYNATGSGPSTTSPEIGIGSPMIQVGNGEVLNHQMPVIFNRMDSMVEVVYLQEWLGAGMIINTISFHASMTSTMTEPRDLEIWLGLTDEDDLSNGWIEGTDFEQVYGGTIIVPPGDSWVEIPLDVDYIYENLNNLVMLVISNDDECYTNTDAFWCTDSGTPARTRVVFYNNATGWEFNAITGPWDSDQIRSLYPDARFYYTPLGSQQTPDESTDVTLVADAGGALETQIGWTCPTLNYGGTALTELLEMRVYRDELLIYTDTSPIIGGTGSYLDVAVPLSGLHEYQVIGYNSFGEGFPVYGWLWVGEDMPNAVDNLVLTQTTPDALSGTLTWDNPTTGSHGGPFNEPILGYHIVRNDSITFELSGSATSYIDDTISISDYYCYTVVPYNGVGDGNGITSDLALIGDADLLILEYFLNGVPPAGWYIDGLGQTSWYSSETDYAGGTAPEMQFDYRPEFYGMSRMCSNALDTSGMNALALEFKFSHNSSQEEGYTLGVATSSDGTTWNDVWTIMPVNSILDTTIYVDITNADVGSDIFQICFYFNGDSHFNYWNIDDVILTDESSLLAPDNVAVDVSLGLVTWDEPAIDTDGRATTDRELTGYNVWLDGVQQNTTLVTDLEYQLTGLENGTSYVTGVSAVYDDPGESEIIEVLFTYFPVGNDIDLPLVTGLGSNYPNPFNPETTISFTTTNSHELTQIDIYNLKGQKIKTLLNEQIPAGQHSVVWNGRNDADKSVSSGVYFYKMKAGKFITMKKMILMK